MERTDALRSELAPWCEATVDLERWNAVARVAPWSAREDPVSMLRALLQSLARREVAIPVEVALPSATSSPWPDRPDPRAALGAWRQRRESILRLAVWRVLRAVSQRPGSDPSPLDTLQVALGATDAAAVPPGLAPTLAFSSSAKAQRFFEGALRDALDRLAARHDPRGAAFGRWATGGAPSRTAIATVATAQGWSRRWSVAVAAVYLDWLSQAADGQLDVAMRVVWRSHALRFRAPSGLVVLPTRERSMHLDLWTDLVSAQALAHDPSRFDDPAGWHCVSVAMHDLGERDRAGTGHVHRGLSVEMLYQAVFAGRALPALRGPVPTRAVMPEPTLTLEIPRLAPGHEANFRVVLRWQQASERQDGGGHDEDESEDDAAATRLAGGTPMPSLNQRQADVLQRWAARAAAADARMLARGDVDWRVDDDALALGHADLWHAAATLGRMPEWLDVALAVRLRGTWTYPTLALSDVAGPERPRCRLELDAPRDGDGVDPRLVRQALAGTSAHCWVARAAGLGAFVMLGIDLDRVAPGRD